MSAVEFGINWEKLKPTGLTDKLSKIVRKIDPNRGKKEAKHLQTLLQNKNNNLTDVCGMDIPGVLQDPVVIQFLTSVAGHALGPNDGVLVKADTKWEKWFNKQKREMTVAEIVDKKLKSFGSVFNGSDMAENMCAKDDPKLKKKGPVPRIGEWLKKSRVGKYAEVGTLTGVEAEAAIALVVKMIREMRAGESSEYPGEHPTMASVLDALETKKQETPAESESESEAE